MNCDKYCDIAKEWFFIVWDFLKEVWALPHSKEMLITLAVLIVIFFTILKVKGRLKPIRLFNNSLGVVEVTKSALDELVQSVCYGMGSLSKPIVRVYTRCGRLSMKISLKLESGQKLAEVSANLQDELTRACREHLGVEKMGRIDIKIRGFKGLLRKPPVKFTPLDEENQKSEDENDPFAVRE